MQCSHVPASMRYSRAHTSLSSSLFCVRDPNIRRQVSMHARQGGDRHAKFTCLCIQSSHMHAMFLFLFFYSWIQCSQMLTMFIHACNVYKCIQCSQMHAMFTHACSVHSWIKCSQMHAMLTNAYNVHSWIQSSHTLAVFTHESNVHMCMQGLHMHAMFTNACSMQMHVAGMQSIDTQIPSVSSPSTAMDWWRRRSISTEKQCPTQSPHTCHRQRFVNNK